MRASTRLAGLTALALMGLAGSAFAQSNPSSDDIINRLFGEHPGHPADHAGP